MYKEYFKRFSLCLLGLMLYGLGNTMGVKAGEAGTNAWSSLSLGVANISGLSFGTATLLISAVVITIDILGKGELGCGMILNTLFIPVFSDMFLAIFSGIPNASNMFGGVILTLLAQVVIAFATVLYLLPCLGAGPRDTLLVIIGRKIPKAPIGAVKFGIEMCVLLVGFLLGAPFGLGTVLILILQASIFQSVCKLCRFEIRSVKHESIATTFKRLMGH